MIKLTKRLFSIKKYIYYMDKFLNLYQSIIYKMTHDMFSDDTHIIKLGDKDFKMENGKVKIINKNFMGKNGYIMAYATWCPNCQDKKTFWSQMANTLNSNPKYKGENVRIGVISTTDPNAQSITKQLGITYIPRFLNVEKRGTMTDYEGNYDAGIMMTNALKIKAASTS
jgi:thiol-disulfide isomerase/thioredoxin